MTSTLTREHSPKASVPGGDPRALPSASLGMASRRSGSGPMNRNTTRIAVGVTVLGAVIIYAFQALAKSNLPYIADFISDIIDIIEKTRK